MKTIYFVRHGQSEANAQRITAGGQLDAPLTDAGREQAREVGRILKKKKIELVVSSPQIRAFETAEIIAREIGYDAAKIIQNKVFAERDLGVMSGRPHDEVQLWFSMGQTPEGGESTEAFQARVMSGLEWLKSQDAGNILLVSHGGVSRSIRAILRGEDSHSIDSLASVGNAQLLEFTI